RVLFSSRTSSTTCCRVARVPFSQRRVAIALIAPALSLLSASRSDAQTRAGADTGTKDSRAPTDAAAAASVDRYSIDARSDTYIQLFRRALQPGPNGAIVTSQTALPIDEYLRIDARDVDAPWKKDSLRVEFSAFAQVWPTSSSYERPFDG